VSDDPQVVRRNSRGSDSSDGHRGRVRRASSDRESGRPMGSLVTGLTKVDGGPLGSCAAGAPVVGYVDYVVPGRPLDDTNASFQALTIGDHVVAMIAYHEQDLNTAVAVYADADGNGLVTNAWSGSNAPQLWPSCGRCAISRDVIRVRWLRGAWHWRKAVRAVRVGWPRPRRARGCRHPACSSPRRRAISPCARRCSARWRSACSATPR
jgi:hypothetical protein